jgi:hypothetical protein
MRQWSALGVGLLCWVLVGCVSGPTTRKALKRPQPFSGLRGPDVVSMEIALLECPIGDHYINTDLWNNFADEQIISPEQQLILENNGFRVAQIGGLIPEELQELLTNCRSNANPRQRQVRAGHTVDLNLGPVATSIQFSMTENGDPVEVTLDQAQCKLLVEPRITADGKTKLHFTPQVEHGEPTTSFHPNPDGSGWGMTMERPKKTYPALGWDVTLEPNQYLVIGARFDKPQTIGHASFVEAGETRGVQRLLVIRISRPGVVKEERQEVSSRRSLPLALQAQMPGTTIRGTSQ